MDDNNNNEHQARVMEDMIAAGYTEQESTEADSFLNISGGEDQHLEGGNNDPLEDDEDIAEVSGEVYISLISLF